MAGKKISAAEVEARVIEVQRLHLQGYTAREMYDLCKHWSVTNKTINNYISTAKTRINEINQNSIVDERDRILKNYWILFRKAEGDPKEQARLLTSISKLCGLEKTHLSVNLTGERILKDLSNEELDKLIKEPDDQEDS